MARLKKETIGIGITTHNRYDLFKKTFDEITKFAPKGAKIVVVDDASDIPCPEATFRFESNVGIAAAKNKCFELLEKCDHIFLFDDDTYPIVADWHKPYIESKEPHLAYIFKDFKNKPTLRDTVELFRDSKNVAFSHQRGCMLYYKNICLKVVGGMDWTFGRWGYEHPNLADRIYNAGLTTFRFMDAAGSENLFYSADEYEAAASTTSGIVRQRMIAKNAAYFTSQRNLKTYIDYKKPPLVKPEGENVVITSYFNGFPDPQRNYVWEADASKLNKLIQSIGGKARLIVLTDCLKEQDTEAVTYVQFDPITINPYYARWILGRQWLAQHPEVGNAWFVDATDVEMVNNPFPDMKPGELYTGDENSITATPYMLDEHPGLRKWLLGNAQHILLNAGLLGGSREMLIDFTTKLITEWEDNKVAVAFHNGETIGECDMAVFNFIARHYFGDKVRHGRIVNTVFKRYQNTIGVRSWWKHK